MRHTIKTISFSFQIFLFLLLCAISLHHIFWFRQSMWRQVIWGEANKGEVALRVKKEFDKNKQKGLRIAIDSHHLLIAQKVTEMDFLFKFSNLFQRFSFLKIYKNTKRWWEAEGLFFFQHALTKKRERNVSKEAGVLAGFSLYFYPWFQQQQQKKTSSKCVCLCVHWQAEKRDKFI